MLSGIKFQVRPTPGQAKILCSWMGAAKFIWNAKCDEDRYLRTFARKYLPIGTFPEINQQYSQYKNEELSQFLSEVPSQILRNSASNWYASYQQFFKQKDRGLPRRKKRGEGMSIHLTRELFEIKRDEKSGEIKIFVETKKNNIGFLSVNWHTKKWLDYGPPNSIRIKKLPSGKFTVSFCFGEEEKSSPEKIEQADWLKFLREHKTEEELEKIVEGVDRGTVVMMATGKKNLTYSNKAVRGLVKYKKILAKNQKKFVKQKDKKSKRREKRRLKIANTHQKISNIRENEIHHMTKKMVNGEEFKDTKVFVLEDLKTKNMTKSAKGSAKKPGKRMKAKSGLNREILDKCWHKIEIQLKYKARKYNKVVFKINPAHTSQECVHCGHTHLDNRLSRDEFKCVSCGHTDHADTNAANVIKKRAVKMILDSGTELSDKGVLRPKSDTGRGAKLRPLKGKPSGAQAKDLETRRNRQKRKELAA